MSDRRIGADLRRWVGFFFSCAEHGIWKHPDLPVDVWPVQCRLRIWHKGPHDFTPLGEPTYDRT